MGGDIALRHRKRYPVPRGGERGRRPVSQLLSALRTALFECAVEQTDGAAQRPGHPPGKRLLIDAQLPFQLLDTRHLRFQLRLQQPGQLLPAGTDRLQTGDAVLQLPPISFEGRFFLPDGVQARLQLCQSCLPVGLPFGGVLCRGCRRTPARYLQNSLLLSASCRPDGTAAGRSRGRQSGSIACRYRRMIQTRSNSSNRL